MNQWIISTILSVAIVHPLKSTEMLALLTENLNPGQFIEKNICPLGVFDLTRAQKFINQLKCEIKEKYDLNIDLESIVQDSLRIMTESGHFSDSEIAIAEEFFTEAFTKKAAIRCGSRSERKRRQELVLPDKMALGFVCILSGSLLCVLPFGITQGIGTGLIGTGIYSVLDGAREGEKPFYKDREAGKNANDWNGKKNSKSHAD